VDLLSGEDRIEMLLALVMKRRAAVSGVEPFVVLPVQLQALVSETQVEHFVVLPVQLWALLFEIAEPEALLVLQRCASEPQVEHFAAQEVELPALLHEMGKDLHAAGPELECYGYPRRGQLGFFAECVVVARPRYIHLVARLVFPWQMVMLKY
jgi:hypothetical protein